MFIHCIVIAKELLIFIEAFYNDTLLYGNGTDADVDFSQEVQTTAQLIIFNKARRR